MVPVNFVSRFIAHIALVQGNASVWQGKCFHLANPEVCEANQLQYNAR